MNFGHVVVPMLVAIAVLFGVAATAQLGSARARPL